MEDSLGTKIRLARSAKRWSRKALSSASGVPEWTIIQIEFDRGYHEPCMERVVRLARALGLEPVDLLPEILPEDVN